MTTKMTKEEKIQEAWGKLYVFVKAYLDADGWCLDEYYTLFDKIQIYDNDKTFDFVFEGEWDKCRVLKYRPKSLIGIEDYYSFLDVKGFENYKVNKQGIVVSKSRISLQKNGKKYTVKEKIMKPKIDNTGYIVFGLRNTKKETKKVYLHRILAECFITNNENKPCVNHKDGVKYNNSLSNLEWCTYQENNIHAFETGLQKRGKGHHFYNKKGKYCHNSKKIICNDTRKVFDSLAEASSFFNISKSHLSNILKGIRKTTLNISYYQPIVKQKPPHY